MNIFSNIKERSDIFGVQRKYLGILGAHGQANPCELSGLWKRLALRSACYGLVCLIGAASLLPSRADDSIEAVFQLLTSPAYVEKKPSSGYPTAGDWLIGTADDVTIGSSGNNSQGALSHSFADIVGSGGSGFQLAPSLTGTITLKFATTTSSQWGVQVTQADYVGEAAPGMAMNQHLITSTSPAALDSHYMVDGLGNSGTWQNTAGVGGAIEFGMDFYLDPTFSAYPIDATFDNTLHEGYLLAVSTLTEEGLAALSLDDPAGFYSGDFKDYLLNVVAPLLPSDATYLLFTQMDKVNPEMAEPGLPITTASLIGNTTIAYTTSAIPEPSSALMILVAAAAGVVLRRSKRN